MAQTGGKAKRKKLSPPTSGWQGGSEDRNGLKVSETYGYTGKAMPRSQTWKKGKVGHHG